MAFNYLDSKIFGNRWLVSVSSIHKAWGGGGGKVPGQPASCMVSNGCTTNFFISVNFSLFKFMG